MPGSRARRSVSATLTGPFVVGGGLFGTIDFGAGVLTSKAPGTFDALVVKLAP